ncbi:hypothetical protein FIA58_013965 [Flavobacterium jejuense]|uniref:Uncharacterized protein n=1 Tax=Flavobacterium jejuense TaxID=1544455 RepID=A0ABX0IVI6_9FLAO|nr:hypothetical protein [Flavobacterium jejuense]NHN26787.1 hypothetical protein [Flavobacterium jejuense]
MNATKEQKRAIAIHSPNKDTKEEWVQWATADVKKTSTNDLTFDQANIILEQLGQKAHKAEYWAVFDIKNPKHKTILSLMRQAQWTKPNAKHGEVADMDQLDKFLKSNTSPVKKPLQKMEPLEVEKIISALNGIVKSKYK